MVYLGSNITLPLSQRFLVRLFLFGFVLIGIGAAMLLSQGFAKPKNSLR
jgi:hypothetical protein